MRLQHDRPRGMRAFPRERARRLLAVAFGLLLIGSSCAPGVRPRLTLHDPSISDQDDLCIWIHPTDRARSTIIASDKGSKRLFVYDLSGRTIQSLVTPGRPGNIDVRYGFPLAGRPIDLVAVNDRAHGRLLVYAIDPETRTLARVDDGSIQTLDNYGSCLYRSPRDGAFYAMITSEEGVIRQLRLDDANGRVAGALVRSWKIGGRTEGCVCDDETGLAYFGEEDRGIWKVGAEPDAPTTGTLIAQVGDASGLVADVEGLAIYHAAGGGGYLIASSQGNSRYVVYRREPPHAHVKMFAVAGVSHTDGLDVTSVPLGTRFPAGLLAMHNDSPRRKAIEVCGFEDLGLAIDSTWSPRRALPPSASGTSPVTATGSVTPR